MINACNREQGGVSISFKQSLPFIKRETIVKQISVNNEAYLLACFYRSVSQDHDEFHNFCSKVNHRLTNMNNNQTACSILKFDFHEKSLKWYRSDKNNTAVLDIDNTTKTPGYSQLKNKPTHFINGTSSCINLIFSYRISFIRNYEIERSISVICYHSITCGTLNFNVPLILQRCRH